MTPRARHLLPDEEERRAARLWLLPWARSRGWWKVLGGLALGLALGRALLLAVSHRVWFMNDSAEYVQLVDDLFVPRTRPPGVSVFWRIPLAVSTSFEALLVAQGLLGVLSGLVAYCIGREIGLRSRAAVVAAVVASSTPTLLFFERVLLAETLAVLLALCTTWLVLVAVRTRATTVWALAGLVGASAVLVRTVALLALPVFAGAALLATRGSLLRRGAALVAFSVAALVPIGGYAFAAYVDARALTGTGRFGLQFTDGFAYFAATAPLTDCRDPEEPPAIRARVCAVPGYLERDPDTIVWGEGPVNDALRSRRYIAQNDALRELALESVARDPIGFASLAGGRFVRMLSTYDNEYFTDADGVVAPFLEAAGLPTAQPRDRFASVWPVVLDGWAVARWGLWLGVAAALVVVRRRWHRGGREVLIVVVPSVVTFAWLVVTTTAVARYLVLFEPFAVLALAWLAQTARDDRRFHDLARRATPAPADAPVPG